MHRLLRLLTFTITLFLALGLIYKTYAEEQFIVEYDITYNITTTGETQVDQTITLTNLQKDVVATSYSLLIKKLNVYEIYGYDIDGQMQTQIDQNADQIDITAKLNKQIIGEGKQNKFTLTYKTKDIAKKVGNIWNINIPRSDTASASRYNVTLSVPKELGPSIFISPKPDVTKDDGVLNIYSFSKETVQNTGITAAFGEHQDLNFNLTYQLKNDSVLPRTYEIALPTDKKGVQQISYSEISPAPIYTFFDKDNNYIARFILKPKELLEVNTLGSARLFSKQIDPRAGGKFSDIPKQLSDLYTKAQPYWETTDQSISDIATKLKDTNLTVSENAKRAYDHVVRVIEYDFDIDTKEAVTRHGAKTALTEQPPAACMEFTDSFIAIARAMGIPARELNGYAFTNDIENKPLSVNLTGTDLLHAWPEYYDPNFGWVPIDPTWGKTANVDYFTKLDTNHFAFVTKGVDSDYPVPAGGYRTEANKKLVEVDFAQNNTENKFTTDLRFYKNLTLNPIELLRGNRLYTIANLGNTFIYNIQTENFTAPILRSNRKIKVYLKKDISKIIYEDINGNKIEHEVKIATEKLPKTVKVEAEIKFIISRIFVVFVVALLLYVMFYNVINLVRFLKKLIRHLYLRLRGQDR